RERKIPRVRDLKWEEGRYERVGEFKYLGIQVTEDEVSPEIKALIAEELYQDSGEIDLVVEAKKRRLYYLGHVVSMEDP
ncbi:hypothetical protein ANN_01660, partial [Periplaneta americana]